MALTSQQLQKFVPQLQGGNLKPSFLADHTECRDRCSSHNVVQFGCVQCNEVQRCATFYKKTLNLHSPSLTFRFNSLSFQLTKKKYNFGYSDTAQRAQRGRFVQRSPACQGLCYAPHAQTVTERKDIMSNSYRECTNISHNMSSPNKNTLYN